MLSDTIADFLTRIRNGYLAKKTKVLIPASKMKIALAEVLKANGYLSEVEIFEEGVKKNIQVTLVYPSGKPALKKLVRISKAGRRVYAGHDKLPYVLSGHGMSIVSTSKGVMTAGQARKLALGGEIICNIW